MKDYWIKMEMIIPDWPCPDNVSAVSSFRYGGVSAAPYHGRNPFDGGLNLAMHVGDKPEAVLQNRKLLRQFLPAEPAWLNQVHSNIVVDAASIHEIPDADASLSIKSKVVCVAQTADCLPVLLCDTEGTVVAVAHAGWRGLAGGILENTIQKMRQASARNIIAWLGPAIGPSHFEVGEEVKNIYEKKDFSLGRHFHPREEKTGKYLADMYALAQDILNREQVMQVYGGNFCTVRDNEKFYSYRRDGMTGRMATCIWLK